MRLYFDLDLGKLVVPGGFRRLLKSVEFKRGDSEILELAFLRGTVAAALVDPVEMVFVVKASPALGAAALMLADSWALDTGVWSAALGTEAGVLTGLLGDGQFVDLLGEFTFTESGGGAVSSQLIRVRLYNDLWKGTEFTPPGMPDPEEWLAAQGLESASNKSSDIVADQASATKYPAVKALWDWAVGKFALLAHTHALADATGPRCIVFTGDFRAAYRTSPYVKLLDLTRMAGVFPAGITLTSWSLDCVNNAAPSTNINANLAYCDAPGAGAMPGASPVLLDVLDTDTGNSSCGSSAAMEHPSHGVVPAGKVLYLQFDADPADYSTLWSLSVNFEPTLA